MECSEFGKNGDNPRPPGSPDEIKIVVVGEPGCGKSKFIKKFCEFTELNDSYEADNCKIYCFKYCMSHRTRRVRVFEFNGFRGEDPSEALKNHEDSNGFVLMYAIDDPLSFERVNDKWYATLEGMLTHKEQAILVGNKRDLRDNPQVTERLARVNQKPVTKEEGENLVGEKAKILKYFDCSSTLNENVNEAFEYILGGALANLINKVDPYSEDEVEDEGEGEFEGELLGEFEGEIEDETEDEVD